MSAPDRPSASLPRSARALRWWRRFTLCSPRSRSRLSKRRPLLLRHGNVGGVLVLHADHVVAGVDMQDLAGHAAAEIGQQIERAAADILDGDGAAERRVVLVPLQDIAEVGDAGGGKRLDRPGRDGVDADARSCRDRRRDSARSPRARPWPRPSRCNAASPSRRRNR